MQSTDDELRCIRYTSLLIRGFYRLLFAARCNQLPLYRSGFIRV